jgi:hypothetical protein
MVPFSFDISKLHKHFLLFYVVIKIDDTHNKVIVFNSLDKLVFIYNNLHDLVKKLHAFNPKLQAEEYKKKLQDFSSTYSKYISTNLPHTEAVKDENFC